jgi:hypothetical protein
VLKGDQREVLRAPFKSLVNQNFTIKNAMLKGDQRKD